MARTWRPVALVAVLVALVAVAPASAGFQTFSSVSAGAAHSCAVSTLGAVECWGDNAFGQMGNGTTAPNLVPADVPGVAGATAVSTAYWHTCALLTGGAVACWGANGSGQVGNGSTAGGATPSVVAGLSGGVSAVSAGGAHTCALIGDGRVRCWGANDAGQLGDGSTAARLAPVEVPGLSGVLAVSAGGRHTCALLAGGAVRCWGSNASGQLGDGTRTASSTPVEVAGLAGGAVAITAGDDHTCALMNGGTVRCWGDGNFGQLGNGGTGSASSPVEVVGLTAPVTAVSAGDDHTCGVLATGGITCWGWNIYGKLGNGTTSPFSPVPADAVNLPSPMAGISAGRFHSCALTSGGLVRCWGRNSAGQLGSGLLTDSVTTVEVAFPILPEPEPPLAVARVAKKKAAPRNPCLKIKGKSRRAACLRLRRLAAARAACRRLPARRRAACLARVARTGRR